MSGIIQHSGRKFMETAERVTKPARRIWPRLPEAIIGTFAIAAVVFSLMTFSPSLARWASELTIGNKYLALADGMLNPFRNRNVLLKSGLPIYDLKIKRQPYAVIEGAVAKARKQGWMSDDLKVWVYGKFLHGNEQYNVKVRVRGDLPPHWAGPKKSWRIKFGKQEIEDQGEVHKEPIYFQGKRQINLVIPRDRDFVVAPFVNSLMRDAGLVVPRDRFVILRINGRLQGLYYEVEHFDKPLLSVHRRPETTIFGQNDRAMHFEQYTKYGTPGTSDAKYDIGSMRRAVDREGQLAMRAMQVLIDHCLNPTPESFRRVRAVLDWKKYLQFRNLTTLFNTNHVRFGSDNLRLYYDSSRGLLEPVPWDVHLVRMPKEPGTIDFWNSHGLDEIQRSTLLDPKLRMQRNKLLWELVGDGGDKLIARFAALHRKIRPLAWADVLSTPIQAYKMDVIKKNFEYNVRRVHKVLSHSSASFVYRLEADDRAALEITATNFSGVHLRGIRMSAPDLLEGVYRLYEDANHDGELDSGDPLVADETAVDGTIRFTLDHYVFPELKYGSETIDGVHWEFYETLSGRSRFFLVGRVASAKRDPVGWMSPEIQVFAANAVSGQDMPSAMISQKDALPENSIGITSYDTSDVFDLEAPELSRAEFLKAHPEFSANPQRDDAVELRGAVTIGGTIIIPKSVRLILQPGTDVTMLPRASVLSYGGLTAVGKPGNRIRIHEGGSGEPWGTFAVVRPPEEVVMKHVDVQGGGQAEINGILLSGGFAVHDGDLRLDHCSFIDMQSEDGLNLKNGRIWMNDCLVKGNASDGVDIDFGTGEVRNSHFINSVNDGLDISGSRLTVVNCRFEHNGDKGFSVGEASHPVLINCLFRGNVIAISSKDLSHARVAHATFVANQTTIEAKRKKPMFGRGTVDVVNSVFWANKVLMQEDYFSRGRITLRNSLFDAPVDFPSCRTGEIGFLSPESGDYRLSAEAVDGGAVALARKTWLNPDETGSFPDRPGVYTELVNSWSKQN